MPSPNWTVVEPKAISRDAFRGIRFRFVGARRRPRSVMYSKSSGGVRTAAGASVNNGFACGPVYNAGVGINGYVVAQPASTNAASATVRNAGSLSIATTRGNHTLCLSCEPVEPCLGARQCSARAAAPLLAR